MRNSLFKKEMGGNPSENPLWVYLDRLYDKFIENGGKGEGEKIPKKIHQVWLGKMPENHKKLIPKIIEKHPDWEYKLWTDDDLKDYPMVNKKLFNDVSNLGSKSDIARYEILYKEGGIYLDSDFEMVKNFDSLIDNEFFTGVGHSNEPMVYNGLIGCTKNNELMGKILSTMDSNYNQNPSISSGDPMYSTGPYYFSSMFFDYIKENMDKKIVVLPTPYFYPLPATERFKIRNREKELKDFIYSFNSDKTICIHLWYNSWQ
jgi:mannosyltransferase OCH1-like enzyme